MNPKEQFSDDLFKNIRAMGGRLDCSKKGSLIKTTKNTALFAKALHQTFGDARDVAGLLAMTAACDFSELDREERL